MCPEVVYFPADIFAFKIAVYHDNTSSQNDDREDCFISSVEGTERVDVFSSEMSLSFLSSSLCASLNIYMSSSASSSFIKGTE